MTAIWQNDGQKWTLLSPAEFPDESTLHRLVEEAPQLLPLAGNPTVVIVGREVQLGTGFADLIGIEPDGRPVVIEIKLARNAEARRAVVAQTLAYAAYLYGLEASSFESDVLFKHLGQRGHTTLAAAVSSLDQEGEFDAEEFAAGLSNSLAEGIFRIVFVLDEAPDELVRLVGYLEAISEKILIDLVTISSYRIGESTIIVPQRVDPERVKTEPSVPSRSPKPKGRLEPGASDFIEKIALAKPEEQAKLRKLVDWAVGLENEGLCKLSTYHGVNRWILLPRLQPENVGLVSVWNDGSAYIQFWRSVFEKYAPTALAAIERSIAPMQVRQGNTLREFSDELFNLLTDAYREATFARSK